MGNFKYLSQDLIEQICYYTPLADWFKKNEFRLSYFNLMKKGCLHMEDIAHHDVVVLGRMADAAYTCLEDETVESKVDRAYNAAKAIQQIYIKEGSELSNDAKKALYIDASKKKFEYLPKEIVEQISCYAPLADWFSKNQFRISYFNLTKKGIEEHGHNDVVVLVKMTNAIYSCLEDKTVESKEERAYNAAMAVQEIYIQEEHNLSDDAKTMLSINIESRKKTRK